MYFFFFFLLDIVAWDFRVLNINNEIFSTDTRNPNELKQTNENICVHAISFGPSTFHWSLDPTQNIILYVKSTKATPVDSLPFENTYWMDWEWPFQAHNTNAMILLMWAISPEGPSKIVFFFFLSFVRFVFFAFVYLFFCSFQLQKYNAVLSGQRMQ